MQVLQGFAWLLVLQALGEAATHAFALPVPGPIVGFLLLLPLLRWQPVRGPVGAAAEALLAHLALLFVPVGVGVITHLHELAAFGWKLMLVILVSTGVGLAVTAALMGRHPHGADDPLDDRRSR